MPVPEKLKGKLFDKNGILIEVFTREIDKLYTADGEEIYDFDMKTGAVTTVSQAKEKVLEVKDANELNKYTCFNVILPSYLPEGYKFDRAEFNKNEAGVVKDSSYISLYFTNEKTEKYIYMQQRFASEGMKSASDGNNIEKIKINGVDAILSDGKEINWETSDVIYFLTSKSIKTNELIKIAESIK